MKKRPTSITVISWWLIIENSLSLIGHPLFLTMNASAADDLLSLTTPIQLVIMYIGWLIGLTAGIAMLKGRSWGRVILIGWWAMTLVFYIATSQMTSATILGFILLFVFTFFLYRSMAHEYFADTEGQAETQST